LVAPNALNQSGRGGRDRHSKFDELSDNLSVRLPGEKAVAVDDRGGEIDQLAVADA
jgi:hypothetical protein